MLAAGLSVASTAAAAPPADATVLLTWVVPPAHECLDVAKVQSTVEARLGRAVFLPAPDSLHVDARFLYRGSSPSVELEISSWDGKRLGARSLTSPGCAELAASLPVVIAVLIESRYDEASAPSSEASPATEPESPVIAPFPPPAVVAALSPLSPPPDAPVTPAPAAPPPERRNETSLGAMLGLSSGGQLGAQVEAGLDASVSLVFPLELAMWLGGRLPASTLGDPSMTLWSLAASVGACGAAPLGSGIKGGLCAGGGARLLHASGDGFPLPESDLSVVPEVRLEARLELALSGPFQARLAGGGTLPLVRPSYGYVDDSGDREELFQPGFCGFAHAGLAVVWR